MSEPAPVFNQFNLVVSDMDATLAFFRRLGLTIPETDPAWARHHRTAEMPGGIDLDLDSVEFARQWNRGWQGGAGGGMGATPASGSRTTRSGALATRWWRIPTATRWAS